LFNEVFEMRSNKEEERKDFKNEVLWSMRWVQNIYKWSERCGIAKKEGKGK